jgi:four helix bundle protein
VIIERFEDIDAWQLGRELTKQVYACTKGGPFARDYGLRDQIRRAAGSAMHNIAEGFDSGSDSEFVRFLRYAQRSCTEIQSELYVAFDQKYISDEEFRRLYDSSKRVHSVIGGFIKYLLTSSKGSRTRDQGPGTKKKK